VAVVEVLGRSEDEPGRLSFREEPDVDGRSRRDEGPAVVGRGSWPRERSEVEGRLGWCEELGGLRSRC
jgi:hypothetical protein